MEDAEKMEAAGLLLTVLRREAQRLDISPGDWVCANVREACDTLLAQVPKERRREGIRMMHDAVDGYLGGLITQIEQREAIQDEAVKEALSIIEGSSNAR